MAIDRYDKYKAWASHLAKREFNLDLNPKDFNVTFSCPLTVELTHSLVGKVSVRYYYTNFLDKKRDFREGFGSDCFEDFERGFKTGETEDEPCYRAGAEMREKYFK